MKFHRFPFLVLLLLAAVIVRAPGERGVPDEAAALAVLSSSDSSLEAKSIACGDLSIVGTAKSVPALAKLLGDEKLNDYARNALELIPDAAAGEALLAALKELKGNLLIGVVITLGDRGEKAAVPALQKMATGPDNVLADAALSSLALIATDEASETIVAVLNETGDNELKIAAAHAALLAAERMSKDGRSGGALLAAVRAADVPAHVKNAAK